LRAPRSLGPRPRAPLPRESRFSGPRRRSPTSATDSTRGHTLEPSILAREQGFHLAAGARSPSEGRQGNAGCVGFLGALPHLEPASRSLHAPAFTVAFHLRGRSRSRAGALETGERALLTIARALLVDPRAPGSPARLTTWPGRPGSSSHRPRLFLNATSRKVAPSRESRCLPSQQNPYASEGLLPPARLDRCPSRCLGGGVAREQACLCYYRPVPSSDEESTGGSSARRKQWISTLSAGRSTHHDFYERISSRAHVPRTS